MPKKQAKERLTLLLPILKDNLSLMMWRVMTEHMLLHSYLTFQGYIVLMSALMESMSQVIHALYIYRFFIMSVATGNCSADFLLIL